MLRVSRIMTIIDMMNLVTKLQKESDSLSHFTYCSSFSREIRKWLTTRQITHWGINDNIVTDLALEANVLFSRHIDFFMGRAQKLSTNG